MLFLSLFYFTINLVDIFSTSTVNNVIQCITVMVIECKHINSGE